MLKNLFTRGASLAAIAALSPVAAVYAQETASELRGTITDANGAAVSGATVTIVHEPTGSASVVTTNASGSFFQTGLRPGGPYTVSVSAPGFEGEALTDLRLAPGQQPPLRIRLGTAEEAEARMSAVVVTGAAINRLSLNDGVGSSYGSKDIADQPGIARDLIATLNRDPLAISSGPNNLSVAGVNPRFNGVTIDGARQQDNFGLGSNTFATNRSPINIDVVESVSLAASDYSVTASGFTGGLVNVTTKGGTNELDGSVFYYYRDQDFLGTSTFGGAGKFNPGEFEEKEYGVTLRGPIIKDRLFFSGSYDKFETARLLDFTAGNQTVNIQPGFFAALNTLVRNTYNIDMGGRPDQTSIAESSERIFGRVDWQITDDHRAQFTYQKTEEASVSSGSAENPNDIRMRSAWYDIPQTLESYTAQLFSDWTPNFSTRLRASYVENARGQICRAGPGVGELQFVLSGNNVVGTPLAGLLTSGASTRTIIGGCDRFRHANDFADERLQVIAQGDYTWNDWIFTFGGEYERFDLYNVFVSDSRGTFIFVNGPNIAARVANVTYQNDPSNNALNAAADWGFARWAAFSQARWQINPTLELSAGVRYEVLSTDDKPRLDPSFQTSVGIPNNTTTDGLDLILPRLSFRWEPLSRTTVTGGVGLFSGGDPVVWTSNAFQPPVVRVTQNGVTNVDPRTVPANLVTQVATGTPRAIDAIDPKFELPSDWKASIKVDQEFDLDNVLGFNLGTDYLFSAQVLYTKSKDSFLWREYGQTNAIPPLTTGFAPDGRPIYADLNALGRQNRTVLTNGEGDESIVFTASIDKTFDNGLGLYAAYSFQDVEMITEGTSSRGISAYRGQVSADRNFPEPRTSIFEVEDAFKLGISYERDFIGNLTTTANLFGTFQSGGRFTYTFDIDNNNALFGRPGAPENPFDNNPLYVPRLDGTDTRVVFAPTFNQQAFAAYVKRNGIRTGEIHKVNSAASTWNQRWDLRLQQELPGVWGLKDFIGDNRFKLVLDIENLGNLINDEWGTFSNAPLNGQLPIVRADLVRRTDVQSLGITAAPALTGDAARTACTTEQACVYRFNTFTPLSTGSRSNAASVWRARVGIRYEF